MNRVDVVLDSISKLTLAINVPGTDALIGSEESLEATIRTVLNIVDTASQHRLKYSQLCDRLQSAEFRPILAHFVLCLVKRIRTSKNKKSALQAIKSIVGLSSSVAASFLPGVSSAIIDALVNIDERNQEDFELCFVTLTVTIVKAVDDSLNQKEEWRNNAAVQLNNLVTSVSARFLCDFSPARRTCLATFAENLLTNEAQVLKFCRKRLIEVLVTLSVDQNAALSSYCLAKISDIGNSLTEDLFAILTSTCRRLPRMSQQIAFDVQQRVEWQLFNGCLKTLSSEMRSKFFLQDQRARLFCRSMCESIEFCDIIWEFDVGNEFDSNSDRNMSNSNQQIALKCPHDYHARQLLTSCFYLLANCTELGLILDSFYSSFTSKHDQLRSQSAFILNGILASSSSKDISLGFAENLLENFLNWIDDEKSTDIELALALNGLAVIGSLIKVNIRLYLVRSLYLILRISNSTRTRHLALVTLLRLAKSIVGEGATAKDLIMENFDYLTSSILTKFKHLSLNPDAPVVLSSLLTISGVENVDRLYFAVSECGAAVDRCGNGNSQFTVLIRCLATYARICSGIQRKEEVTAEPTEEDDGVQQKPVVPRHVKLIERNLHTIHCWLGAQAFEVRVACLEALRDTLNALKLYEDILLPAIHQSWPSLLGRLNDRESACKLAAYDVMMTTARLSGSFVRHRIEQEAFAFVEKFVKENVEDVRRAGVAYTQSAAFRLQVAICCSLGELCSLISPTDEFVDRCRRVLEIYHEQNGLPKSLCEPAEHSLRTLNKK